MEEIYDLFVYILKFEINLVYILKIFHDFFLNWT